NLRSPLGPWHGRALVDVGNDQIPTCTLADQLIDELAVFGERQDRGRRGTLREDGVQDGALPGKTWHCDDDQRTFTPPNFAQRLRDVRRHRPISDKVVEA